MKFYPGNKVVITLMPTSNVYEISKIQGNLARISYESYVGIIDCGLVDMRCLKIPTTEQLKNDTEKRIDF